MAFCTNCGAQSEGAFCKNCGAAMGAAAGSAQPAPPPPPAGAPEQPAKKKTSPWVWVIGGCLVLVVIIVLVLGAMGLFVAKKVKDAGDNPALAAATLLAAANPDIEVVSSDKARGTVTMREKKTGKTVTLNLDDVKNGHISFESEGEKLDFQGSAGAANIPDWVPRYPGAPPQGAITSSKGRESGGMFTFKTSDSAAKVAAHYEQELKGAGMTVEKNTMGELVTLNCKDDNRQVDVVITPDGSGANAHVTYKSK
jgi:hypothetical protein